MALKNLARELSAFMTTKKAYILTGTLLMVVPITYKLTSGVDLNSWRNDSHPEWGMVFINELLAAFIIGCFFLLYGLFKRETLPVASITSTAKEIKPTFQNAGNMETNPLGKSIVRASIILASALLLSMIFYVVSKDRYTYIGQTYGHYIDQKTGVVYDNDKNAQR
ncbi:MAG: hypothetical protein M1292_06940 [Bacteroidetes bacterium]|nr:hypothetical protein [Bacteroidota bacterium]